MNSDDRNARRFDLVIIGGGPAGLSAGLYAARSRINTLLIEQLAVGGQATTTHMIENYPGFVNGVGGQELADLMCEQAERFGLQIEYDAVEGIAKQGDGFALRLDEETLLCRAIVVAAGANPRQLGVPGETERIGKGVSYCATCDGAFFDGKTIAVVGGGNSALEEALYLTRFAQKVFLIHRRDQLRAAKILQQRAFDNEKIEIVWDSVVEQVLGDNEVNGIRVFNAKLDQRRELALSGVFVAIGQTPNSGFLGDLVLTNTDGFILTSDKMQTSCPGIFAAGDICEKPLRQVVTAANDGAIAGHFVQEWLELSDKPNRS